MKAVILAAGEGERFQPITMARPKHLIKVGGKPILEHCLNALKTAGVEEAVIVVYHMADAIRQYFGDGKKFGLNIEYVEQKALFGIGNAPGTIELIMKEDFVLVNGDMLFSPDPLRKVICLHQKEKAAATMAVVPVDKPDDYWIVELEDEKRVKHIVKKPNVGVTLSDFADAGIYVLSTEVFAKLRKIAPTENGLEIPEALSILTSDSNAVLAVKIPSEDRLSIDRPWNVLDANRWVLTRMKSETLGIIEEGAHLIGPVALAENACVRSGAYIEGPTFIGELSEIGPNCYIRPFTSVCKNVMIGNASEIENSIVMDGTHIGQFSYVGDSILGENCDFGAGTITANYRLDAGTIKMVVEGELVDSGRNKLGAILGDNVRTGIDALFMPGVVVGQGSQIGPNVVVQRDVMAKSVILLKQEVDKRT
jgi:bifunctional UDP-N-acetylglucosamine pyrophosphorylase/glucosamine-1-phosphate N-acetyltransferase